MKRLNRHCAGYYYADVLTTVDGQEEVRRVEIVKVEGQDDWYWTMDKKDGTQTEAGDYYPTKRDAVESMMACMEAGWIHYPGLGLCVNNSAC